MKIINNNKDFLDQSLDEIKLLRLFFLGGLRGGGGLASPPTWDKPGTSWDFGQKAAKKRILPRFEVCNHIPGRWGGPEARTFFT